MKLIFATWLLLLLALYSSSFLEFTTAQSYPPAHAPPLNVAVPPSLCKVKCVKRCSKSSRRQRCIKYCTLCCRKCNCVPPGTYGNKWMCPCYAKLMSSQGKPKCP